MLVAACVLGIAAPASAQDDMSAVFDKHKNTPEAFIISGPAIYTRSGKNLNSLRGKKLVEMDDSIISAEVNPFCTNFFFITKHGKKNGGEIIANANDVEVLYKVNRKKLGNPWAVTYTSDALHILLATDSGLVVLNAPDRLVLSKTPLVYKKVDRLLASPNGYFLAVVSGSKLAVYNLEEKTLRKEWDFEMPVNDVAFNDNSTEIAVASADGVLSIYDTRNFLIKKDFDDLGDVLSISYNADGKYIAVAESPTRITVVNLLDPADRQHIEVPVGEMSTLRFVPDATGNVMLVHNGAKSVIVRRMGHLTPYYGRLVSDEANNLLNDWMKMLPGETMEQYQARVTDESRERQRRLFEDEVSTRLAPDMLSMAETSLGKYNRSTGLLQVDFSNMPSIFLPVPEDDLSAFNSKDGTLEFHNPKYGVMGDDKFQLIYAEVRNTANGKTYIYNNIDRSPLNFMDGDDNVVSLDLVLQQQMEEKKLEEIRQKVVAEAKSQNVISDHTNITVDSRIEPDFDANGKKILNYLISFTYQVDPEFTAVEDFAPGKYHAEQSGAAKAMLALVKEALEGDFAQYVAAGKKLAITLSGTADATPIVSRILYDGSYGDIVEVPVYKDGQITPMTLHEKDVITRNEELAFLRAYGVRNYLNENVNALKDMKTSYRYDIDVAKDKGSEFRRINIQFKFIDAL